MTAARLVERIVGGLLEGRTKKDVKKVLSDDEMADYLYAHVTDQKIPDPDKRQMAITYALHRWQKRGKKDVPGFVAWMAEMWAKGGREYSGSKSGERHVRLNPLDPNVQKRSDLTVYSMDEPVEFEGAEADEIDTKPKSWHAAFQDKRDWPNEAARKRIDWGRVIARLSPEDQDVLVRLASAIDRGHISKEAKARIEKIIKQELPDYAANESLIESFAAFLVANFLLDAPVAQ